MSKQTYPPKEIDSTTCRSWHQKLIRPFYLLLLLLLVQGNLFSQVLNVTQASVIEGFAGKVPNVTGASAVAVQGNYAYVIGTGDVLQILDITLPGLPVPKGNLYHGTGGASILRAQSIVVRGNYAYITSYGANALEIVDVSDPSKPVHKAALYDGGGSAPYLNQAWGLVISGNYAYVASSGSNALEIIDISNPSDPKHKGSLLDGGGNSPLLNLPMSVSVSGDYAYVGTISGTLEVINISDPSSPTHAGSVVTNSDEIGGHYGIAVSGNYVYLTDLFHRSLEIFDVSNPTLPTKVGRLEDGGNVWPTAGVPPYLVGPWSIFVQGKYAYISTSGFFKYPGIASGVGALEVVDISNPALPVHAGAGLFLRETIVCRNMFVVGNRAYLPSRSPGSLIIADLSDPVSPKLLGKVENGNGGAIIGDPSSVIVDGNYAYVGNRNLSSSNGPPSLEILDVSDPTQPKHLAALDELTTGASLQATSSIYKKGNYLYATSNYYHSLQIVDVTIPSVPVAKGLVSRNFYSPTDPNSPLIEGASDVVVAPIWANAFVVSGEYPDLDVSGAPIKQGSNTLVRFDITDPTTPILENTLNDGNGVAPFLNNPRAVAFYNVWVLVASKGSDAIEIAGGGTHHTTSLHDGGGVAPYLDDPVDMVLQGNFAYVVSSGSKSLQIIDITNLPNTPIAKGSFVDATLLNGVNSVMVSGKYAYITTSTYVYGFVGNQPGALIVIDISDPMSPKLVDTFYGGEGGALMDNPTSVFTSGNYAYVTNAGLSMNVNIAYLFGPKITNVQPTSAPVGSSITVTGENFNTFLTASVNGSSATITNVTATTMTLTVPAGATNGKISIELKGQKISSVNNFIVVPTTATATEVTQTSVVARWSDVGAREYFIDVSNDNFSTFITGFNNRSLGTSTSFTITDLSPGTSYQYRVRSTDDIITSANSNTTTVTTIPATPVTNDATAITQTSFNINWNAVVGTTAYYVDVATDKSFTKFVTGVNNLLTTAITQTIVGADAGRFFYYRVRSFNASGVSPSSIIDSVQTVPSNPLAKNASLITPTSFVLNWSEVPGNTNYHLDVSSDNFNTFISGKQNFDAGTGLSHPLGGLSSGTLYQYRVRASNTSGSSSNSNVISLFTIPATPVANEASTITQNSFTITWTAIAGATSYSIDVATDNQFLALVYNNVPVINQTSYTAASLGSNTQYYFRLRANNSSGSSESSNVISLKTLSTLPTLQSTGIIFTAVNSTSITLNYSPGNGNSHLVVIYPSANTGAVPINGTAYTSSTVFSSGSALGSGFVVSNGVGPITVTGLTPSTVYSFQIFDYNGNDGSENYLTTISATNPVSQNTFATTPVDQPTDLLFTNSAATSVAVAFSAATTNPSGYVVLRSSASPSAATPISGTSYATGTLLGASTVAYVGPSLSFFDGGLPTGTKYFYSVFSYNGSGSSISYLTTSPLQGNATLDVSPPVITSLNNSTTITAGNTTIFNTVITDNVSVATAEIYYRGISKGEFNTAQLNPSGGGGNYSIQIQTDWYDSLGMEYYFVATDQNGNISTKPTTNSLVQLINPSITLPTLPSGPGQNNYRIIAFPYVLASDNKVTTVYNGVPWDDNSKAAMWWWNPASANGQGAYDQYGAPTNFQTIDPGKGYWAITSSPLAPQLSNVNAPKYNQSNLYTMTLKPNWNQVGNPYPVSISWDDVIALNQELNPSAVFSTMNLFDGTGYQSATGDVLVNPFEGGFVKNLTSSDISIVIPFPSNTEGGRLKKLGADLDDEAWKMFLHIEQDALKNSLGGFGMHPLAKDGADRFDNFNPPQMMQAPEVTFHSQGDALKYLCNNIVSTKEEYRWQFTPNGNAGAETVLEWNDDVTDSGTRQLFLLDENLIKVINMKHESNYRFTFEPGHTFSIFYGDNIERKVIGSNIAAVPLYPNPMVTERATINISLPETSGSYRTSLQILSLQGEVIQLSNSDYTSGIHSIEFILEEKNISNGIYLYKLTVSGQKSQKVFTGKFIKL